MEVPKDKIGAQTLRGLNRNITNEAMQSCRPQQRTGAFGAITAAAAWEQYVLCTQIPINLASHATRNAHVHVPRSVSTSHHQRDVDVVPGVHAGMNDNLAHCAREQGPSC
eukprot:scaffold54457_cov22-Tisochrysis_lutea.AAC.2